MSGVSQSGYPNKKLNSFCASSLCDQSCKAHYNSNKKVLPVHRAQQHIHVLPRCIVSHDCKSMCWVDEAGKDSRWGDGGIWQVDKARAWLEQSHSTFEGRPPGNSPELMPLDTSLSQDIHKSTQKKPIVDDNSYSWGDLSALLGCRFGLGFRM